VCPGKKKRTSRGGERKKKKPHGLPAQAIKYGKEGGHVLSVSFTKKEGPKKREGRKVFTPKSRGSLWC